MKRLGFWLIVVSVIAVVALILGLTKSGDSDIEDRIKALEAKPLPPDLSSDVATIEETIGELKDKITVLEQEVKDLKEKLTPEGTAPETTPPEGK